jgi:hypothetical protein
MVANMLPEVPGFWFYTPQREELCFPSNSVKDHKKYFVRSISEPLVFPGVVHRLGRPG